MVVLKVRVNSVPFKIGSTIPPQADNADGSNPSAGSALLLIRFDASCLSLPGPGAVRASSFRSLSAYSTSQPPKYPSGQLVDHLAACRTAGSIVLPTGSACKKYSRTSNTLQHNWFNWLKSSTHHIVIIITTNN